MVWVGDTNQAITLAAVGATLLYVVSMISLFVLRRRAPDLERPFRAPFYPVFPVIALALAIVCLGAVLWSAPHLSAVCAGLFALAALYYRAVAHRRVASHAEDLASPPLAEPLRHA